MPRLLPGRSIYTWFVALSLDSIYIFWTGVPRFQISMPVLPGAVANGASPAMITQVTWHFGYRTSGSVGVNTYFHGSPHVRDFMFRVFPVVFQVIVTS